MEALKPRIEFYRQRSFSEKMNVVFAFIRENWKPLLKYTFYLITPVCLIQTFAMNSLLSTLLFAVVASPDSSPFGSSLAGFLSNYGVILLCNMTGAAIMSGMIYAMMQTYTVRENGLQNITINDFKEILIRNVWKYIRIMLAVIFVFSVIVFFMAFLAAAVSTYSLIVTIPIVLAAIFFLIPLMLVVPAYIFERDIDLVDAIRKGWKLGMATFGGLLGLMIVLYIISSVIQTVVMLPWYLTILIKSILSVSSDAVMTQSPVYKFVLYILGLIQSFGTYAASIIYITGLAFQYFHAREKKEGVTIETNISNFGNL
jgi:hypothetical protein